MLNWINVNFTKISVTIKPLCGNIQKNISVIANEAQDCEHMILIRDYEILQADKVNRYS